MSWNDSRLSWNVKDFENIQFISFHLRDIWRPGIALLNSIDQFDLVDRGMDKTTVWVESSGEVHYALGKVFGTSCDPDITYFPFDSHECYLFFAPFANMFTIVEKTGNQSDVALKDLIFFNAIDEDGKWVYKRLIPCITQIGKSIYYGATFPIRLQRRWGFIFLSVVSPVIVLSFLNLFVFLIPVEAGERITFAITVLLSYTVFMIVLADNIPETSNPMPIISYFLVFKLGYSLGITASIIIVTRLFHRHERIKVPPYLNKMTIVIESIYEKVCCKKNETYSEPYEKVCGKKNEIYSEPYPQMDVLRRKTRREIPSIYDNVPEEKRLDMGSDVTWIRTSKALDKLFLCLFCLIFVLETAANVYFIVIASSEWEMTGDRGITCPGP